MTHGAVHERVALRPEQAALPAGHWLGRLPVLGGAAGAIGLAASLALAGASGDVRGFLFSWLVAFAFFLSLALGALYFVLIHFAVQAGWGIVLRRLAENVAATLPLFAALFLPILFGLPRLYEWATAEAHHDPILLGKAPYLNVPFFVARAVIYFAVWSGLALVWWRASRRQDATGDPAISRRLRRSSGPALIALALTQTFASIDWIMSLAPHWFSTIFGVHIFAGSLLSFVALLAIASVVLPGSGVLEGVLSVEHRHDVGKLLFAFTCFWAYIAFSQFFLIWYANLPEETGWYRARMQGAWAAVSVLLAVGHFVIPFLFLLARTVKRRAGALAAAAVWMLVMHYFDLAWQILPVARPDGYRLTLLDLTALLAVGGLFAATLGWIARRGALVPLRDPRLPESLSYEIL